MRYLTSIAALGLAAGLCAAAVAPAAAADDNSPQAQSCRERAKTDARGQADFYAKCMEGAVATNHSVAKPKNRDAQAIVAPSGAAPAKRSDRCTAEADRRKLTAGERDNFRRACIASAAPVANIGIAGQPTKPTPEKTELGSITAAPKSGKATTSGAQTPPKPQ